MRKIGVIGAGQMGAGIAHVSAQAGYEVLLRDMDLGRAEAGKAGISKRRPDHLIKETRMSTPSAERISSSSS